MAGVCVGHRELLSELGPRKPLPAFPQLASNERGGASLTGHLALIIPSAVYLCSFINKHCLQVHPCVLHPVYSKRVRCTAL